MTVFDKSPLEVVELEGEEVFLAELVGEARGGLGEDRGKQDGQVGEAFDEVGGQ